MKSIIQEASTIAKAVELGWREAGEPKEFSVKVLELPEHNFIGMTTRSAKIAFIFNGVIAKPAPEQQRAVARQAPREPRKDFTPRPPAREQFAPKKEQPRPSYERPAERSAAEQERPAASYQAPARQPEQRDDAFAKRRHDGLWNDDMVALARTWFTTALKDMDGSDITFTIEPQNYYLRITLSRPILANEGQEKHLLASLSLLLFSTIKKEFRKALRGHKVVLTHVQQ